MSLPTEEYIDSLINSAILPDIPSEVDRREAIKRATEAFELALSINYELGKANALQQKGLHHVHLSEFKEGLDAFLQEEKIRREIGDEKGIAGAVHRVANAYHYLNNLQKAMMLYLEAMQKFEKHDDKNRLRSVYNNIGWLHFKIGNYDESLDFYLKCLRLAEEHGDKADLAGAYNAIGTVYQKVNELENALNFYYKSLKLCEEVGSPEGIGIAYGNIGITYHEAKRYEEALEANYQSKRAFEEVRNPFHLSMALASIAASYEALNMENEALFFYDESLKVAKKSGNVQVEVEVLTKQATLLLKRNENEDALHLLRNALRIGKKAQFKNNIQRVYLLLVEAYRGIGDFESALSSHENFYELEKEVFNEESNRKIRNLQVAFELEQGKRETDLERLKNNELTKLNIELSEANRLKTELLGIAAHDLKNPLQSILGFAELIKERTKESTTLQYAQRIRTSSERMLEMITLLLNDAAISEGKIALNLEEVNVSQILESLIHQYKPRVDEKSQTIQTWLQTDCVIRADKLYLSQIFENLLSNAIKYSPKEKQIVIRCEKSDMSPLNSVEYGNIKLSETQSSVLISFIDQGQGLSEDDKSKLFGKFQRLSSKPTGNESSTGLGLAIVKDLVELHKGKIWAQSDGKGKGTTFFILFPFFQNL